MHPSFHSYMERCLYDADSGYYGSGNVEFRGEPHFWTYPQLLSPVFGWVLAERIRETLERWTEAGLLNDAETITVLEIGGGEAVLARDVLDYVAERSGEAAWQQFAGRVEYVIGELSAALRKRQEHLLWEYIETNRARVVDVDARDLSWDAPFKGIVVCNELLDAFPFEKLRVHGPENAVSRVHVRQPSSDDRCGTKAPEELVPLADGWYEQNGSLGEPPVHLLEYLQNLVPLFADLDDCGLLPVDLYWPPSLPHFVQSISRLLRAPGNIGVVFVIDYGGTSRHIVDPRSLAPHMRVYGADRELAHTSDVYAEPGQRDITCDVDFTELARLVRAEGLDAPFFAHQSAIESTATSFDDPALLDALAARLSGNVGYAPGVARLVAPRHVRRFRRSPGYWLTCLAQRDVPCSIPRPASAIRIDGRELWTLAASVDRRELECALRQADLPAEGAVALKPCGDIAADLSDRKLLPHYHRVRKLLDERGWLRPPGEVGAPGESTRPAR